MAKLIELMIYEPPTEQEMAKWTDDWIKDVVEKCVADGAIYDDAMNRALFPNGVPQLWAQWPQPARDAWDRGAVMYLKLKPVGEGEREPGTITLQEAWWAIEQSAQNPNVEVRYSWRDIGTFLNIGERGAQYVLARVYGFVMRGRNYSRKIVAAPCIECGEVWPHNILTGDHKCRKCRIKKVA
jgi:hypothetical protein